jgi:hypothetical protein
MDSKVRTVSYSVSPFVILDECVSNGIMFKPSLLSAISKLHFVLVLGSKNKFATKED